MAQKNATPTKEQAQTLARHKLSQVAWVVVKDLAHSMIIKNRITGEFKVVDK